MATRKKTKTAKAKPKKKKSAARRPAAKKPARKKAVKKKTVKKAVKKAVTKKARARPAAKPKPAAPKPPVAVAALPGETRVGAVTHYFSHLSVAVVKMETGMLREGDTIHIKGHTSDFRQRVGSLEVDHVHVSEVRAGQSAGLKVSEHAREHDVVFKVGA